MKKTITVDLCNERVPACSVVNLITWLQEQVATIPEGARDNATAYFSERENDDCFYDTFVSIGYSRVETDAEEAAREARDACRAKDDAGHKEMLREHELATLAHLQNKYPDAKVAVAAFAASKWASLDRMTSDELASMIKLQAKYPEVAVSFTKFMGFNEGEDGPITTKVAFLNMGAHLPSHCDMEGVMFRCEVLGSGELQIALDDGSKGYFCSRGLDQEAWLRIALAIALDGDEGFSAEPNGSLDLMLVGWPRKCVTETR